MDVRSHCSLWICLAAAGTLACVPPEADYWRDRRNHARPLPYVKLQQIWDHPATLCPETLSDAGDDRVLLHGAQGSAWMDASGMSAPASEAGLPDGEAAHDEIIRRVLERHFAEPVQPTAAAVWRELAIVVVPERRSAHAVHLRKERVVWTVHTGSHMLTAPQVYRSRVILQSLDNYVYCLLADNGHEVWRTQASHRLTRPAAFWNDRVLLIPETSSTVQVFDLYDGSDAGKWSLPDPDDYFTGAPLVMGDTVVASHALAGSPACRLVAIALAEHPRAEPSAPSPASGRHP